MKAALMASRCFSGMPPVRVRSAPGAGNASAGRFGEDFVLSFPKPEAAGQVEADVVFAGYGIVAKEWDWDDFKGADVKGKVLVLLSGEPGGDDPVLFSGKALRRLCRAMMRCLTDAW